VARAIRAASGMSGLLVRATLLPSASKVNAWPTEARPVGADPAVVALRRAA
jgi:hypothetical protein